MSDTTRRLDAANREHYDREDALARSRHEVEELRRENERLREALQLIREELSSYGRSFKPVEVVKYAMGMCVGALQGHRVRR